MTLRQLVPAELIFLHHFLFVVGSRLPPFLVHARAVKFTSASEPTEYRQLVKLTWSSFGSVSTGLWPCVRLCVCCVARMTPEVLLNHVQNTAAACASFGSCAGCCEAEMRVHIVFIASILVVFRFYTHTRCILSLAVAGGAVEQMWHLNGLLFGGRWLCKGRVMDRGCHLCSLLCSMLVLAE